MPTDRPGPAWMRNYDSGCPVNDPSIVILSYEHPDDNEPHIGSDLVRAKPSVRELRWTYSQVPDQQFERVLRNPSEFVTNETVKYFFEDFQKMLIHKIKVQRLPITPDQHSLDAFEADVLACATSDTEHWSSVLTLNPKLGRDTDVRTVVVRLNRAPKTDKLQWTISYARNILHPPGIQQKKRLQIKVDFGTLRKETPVNIDHYASSRLPESVPAPPPMTLDLDSVKAALGVDHTDALITAKREVLILKHVHVRCVPFLQYDNQNFRDMFKTMLEPFTWTEKELQPGADVMGMWHIVYPSTGTPSSKAEIFFSKDFRCGNELDGVKHVSTGISLTRVVYQDPKKTRQILTTGTLEWMRTGDTHKAVEEICRQHDSLYTAAPNSAVWNGLAPCDHPNEDMIHRCIACMGDISCRQNVEGCIQCETRRNIIQALPSHKMTRKGAAL